MNAIEIKQIENIIQYEFKNKKLLEEAFIVNPVADYDAYSSEVFRIPGKRAINFSLTHIVLSIYGENTEEGYRVTTDKDQVNYILDNLYTRDVYARNIQILGLSNYLNIPDIESYDDMSRRLFESLVGAITIDCNWNLHTITEVVKFLLDADYYLENGFENFDNHYVVMLYNWCVENNKSFPVYRYSVENGMPSCAIKVGKELIRGTGKSKTIAKFEAAKKVYEKLCAQGIIQARDADGYIIGEPTITPEESIAYLAKEQEAGKIGDVYYTTVIEEDDFFMVVCSVDSTDFTTEGPGYTVEEAKMNAAYKMVKYLLGYRVVNSDYDDEEE